MSTTGDDAPRYICIVCNRPITPGTERPTTRGEKVCLDRACRSEVL